jgi:hypothetical protein
MRAVVVGVFVVACQPNLMPSAEDCEVVRGDPAKVLKTLQDRHPGDAVGNAAIIERCLAPDGEVCDRVAKILPHLPAMMGRDLPVPEHVAIACRSAPAKMQYCFLPSATLANPDECREVVDALKKQATEIDIKQAR